jgi:Tol biopolymer transport system component
MDNTQLTPLRKRNSKVSRRFASSVEKAMGIDPADRFQNAEEFKRSLLGSKTKTQLLPGEFMVEPPPPDIMEEIQQSSIERASNPVVDFKSGNGKEAVRAEELPVFKPRRRKRKGRRVLTIVLWALLLLSLAIVGAVRFTPQFVPASMMSLLGPLRNISLPFLPTSQSFTAVPPATETLLPLPTVTPLAIQPTGIATLTATATGQPTAQSTPTSGSTSIPVATSVGGGSGQIVFASSRSVVPQLYLVNADGTDLTQLTNMDKGACQPSWAPDGLRLVFISPCLGRAEIFETIYNESSLYMINSDGTELKQLTPSPGSDFEPAWSPDGKQIAFTSVRDGFRQIYALDVDSLAITLLTNTTDAIESSQPSWSPDGTKIVYTVKRVGTYQVWSMNSNGQEAVQLVRSGQDLWDYSPAWSPDGRTIFFSQRRLGAFRPWLMRIDYADLSQDARRMNFITPIEDVEFSSDGFWITYEGMDVGGNRDVYFMTVTGSGRTRLTNDPKIDFDPAWRPIQKP